MVDFVMEKFEFYVASDVVVVSFVVDVVVSRVIFIKNFVVLCFLFVIDMMCVCDMKLYDLYV